MSKQKVYHDGEWKDIHITTNNVDTVAREKADAAQASAVTITGDQTISGTKSFSDIFVETDPSHANSVRLFADQEGGNVRLTKGSGHLEIDTLTADQSNGMGRIYLGNTDSVINTAIQLKQNSEIQLAADTVSFIKPNQSGVLGDNGNSLILSNGNNRALLALRKLNFTSNPGGFELMARNDTQAKVLFGNPDGRLYWDNRSVLVMPKYGSQIYGTWTLQENVQEQIYNYTPSVPCMFVYYATVYRHVQWFVLLRQEPNVFEVSIGSGGQDTGGNTFKQTITGFCPAGVTIQCRASTYNTGGPGGGYIEYRYYPLV